MIQINEKIKFNLKETIKAVNKHIKINYVEDPPHQKDFYNFFTGKITCGKCGKVFKLFHWCYKKTTNNK